MNKCCSLLNTIYLHSKTLKCVRKLEVCLTLVNNLKKKTKKTMNTILLKKVEVVVALPS